jgi:hypothetical protein
LQGMDLQQLQSHVRSTWLAGSWLIVEGIQKLEEVAMMCMTNLTLKASHMLHQCSV